MKRLKPALAASRLHVATDGGSSERQCLRRSTGGLAVANQPKAKKRPGRQAEAAGQEAAEQRIGEEAQRR